VQWHTIIYVLFVVEKKMDNEKNGCKNYLLKQMTMHEKTKHIDIKVHNIQEKAEFEKVGIAYVPTFIQQADFLPKLIIHLHYAIDRKELSVKP
jgi:hypothetical protein